MSPNRQVSCYSDLSNSEVVEIATAVKVLSSMLEEEHGIDSCTIYFREYSEKDIDFNLGSIQNEDGNIWHFK